MEEDILVKKEDNLNQNDVKNNNEQVNMFKEPKKGNGFIIGLLIIMVIGLAGFIVYDKFIKKEEPPKENNTEEKDNNEQNNTPTPSPTPVITPSNNDSLVGKTFKTIDGKKELKIVSKDDIEAKKKAESFGYDADNNSEPFMAYFGYYNGKELFAIYESSEDKSDTSKYLVIGAWKLNGGVGQCRDSHEFVVKVDDNSLVNIDYSVEHEYGHHYLIQKVGNKYYFSAGSCAMAFIPESVYDENLKNIGEYFIDYDENGNVYVLSEKNIVKYDQNGNIVKKGNQKYDVSEISDTSIVFNGTLYIIGRLNDKLYLIDAMTDEKYLLNGVDDYFASPGADSPCIAFYEEAGIIKLFIYDYNQDGTEVEKVLYTFNPSTRELTKAN